MPILSEPDLYKYAVIRYIENFFNTFDFVNIDMALSCLDLGQSGAGNAAISYL